MHHCLELLPEPPEVRPAVRLVEAQAQTPPPIWAEAGHR
jgi:hypothetical protein